MKRVSSFPPTSSRPSSKPTRKPPPRKSNSLFRVVQVAPFSRNPYSPAASTSKGVPRGCPFLFYAIFLVRNQYFFLTPFSFLSCVLRYHRNPNNAIFSSCSVCRHIMATVSSGGRAFMSALPIPCPFSLSRPLNPNFQFSPFNFQFRRPPFLLPSSIPLRSFFEPFTTASKSV